MGHVYVCTYVDTRVCTCVCVCLRMEGRCTCGSLDWFPSESSPVNTPGLGRPESLTPLSSKSGRTHIRVIGLVVRRPSSRNGSSPLRSGGGLQSVPLHPRSTSRFVCTARNRRVLRTGTEESQVPHPSRTSPETERKN